MAYFPVKLRSIKIKTEPTIQQETSSVKNLKSPSPELQSYPVKNRKSVIKKQNLDLNTVFSVVSQQFQRITHQSLERSQLESSVNSGL